MGIYIFENIKTGETKEVFQNMLDEHTYSENGVKWNRVFFVPQASIDARWDIDSPQDFSNKVASKRGKIGDVWDRSKELSEKRASRDGVDPVKEKYKQEWSKKRNGRKYFGD